MTTAYLDLMVVGQGLRVMVIIRVTVRLRVMVGVWVMCNIMSRENVALAVQ